MSPGAVPNTTLFSFASEVFPAFVQEIIANKKAAEKEKYVAMVVGLLKETVTIFFHTYLLLMIF